MDAEQESLQAGATPGIVTTEAFLSQGGEWHVNAQVAEGGRLIVEVLDESGAVVAVSEPITGDHPDWTIRWTKGPRRGLSGRRVRARFRLTRGDLYSYWVAKGGG